MSRQPYDFGQAQDASKSRADDQRASEKWVIDSHRAYAETERAYRKALAAKILELRASGIAISACSDIARGESEVSTLKYKRDVAEGVKEAAVQAAWRASAGRRDEEKFIEWSMRRDLAEGHR